MNAPRSKLQKLYPSAIDKYAMAFVPPLEVEKKKKLRRLLAPLRNLLVKKDG
jgi:hypothetical protein